MEFGNFFIMSLSFIPFLSPEETKTLNPNDIIIFVPNLKGTTGLTLPILPKESLLARTARGAKEWDYQQLPVQRVFFLQKEIASIWLSSDSTSAENWTVEHIVLDYDHTGYMKGRLANEDVNVYGRIPKGPLWAASSLISLTISNTASGFASLRAFSDILLRSSLLVLNHSATILEVSLGLRVKTPAPLSTTNGTLPFS